MSKICMKCQEDLPLEAFGRKRGGVLGVRPRCRKCTSVVQREVYSKVQPPLPPLPKKERPPKPPKPNDIHFEMSEDRRETLSDATRFVVTCALNNSPVDPEVWGAVKQYAKHNKAEIIVLPIRYKNPTTRMDGKEEETGAWWPDEVLPYITDELLELHEHLWVMGHVRVQATARNPLTGLEALSRGSSALFGHPQLAMQMVATPQHKLPKMLHTTGSVSVPNYSTTKAGVQADFHHGMGAVVVELDGDRFYIRGLVGDSQGGFYDVDRYYTKSGSKKSTGSLALVTGDEHAIFADPKCKAATYLNKDSMVAIMRPEKLFRHDVFDGYSISHHHQGNPTTMLAKYISGHNLLEKELQITVDHIDETTPPYAKNYIVSSNHHDHLLQWMRGANPMESDPANLEIWIDLWHMLKPTIKMDDGGATCGNPFELWAMPRLQSDTTFLPYDSGCTVADIALGMHGHNGVNGSRGTLRQFSKIGVKTITGHSHTPGIIQGATAVGTSSFLKLEYTKGLSSWSHANCVVHPNGKKQLLLVIDGHWRLG